MESNKNVYDLHAHFLPGMDDGCKSCAEALGVLIESQKQKIAGIAATPHYYANETITDFIKRRELSAKKLVEYVRQKEAKIPKICYGAEVAYRHGISKDPDLPLLCYGNSQFILLELPFSRWEKDVLYDMQEICSVRGLVPVIAHLERYVHFQDREILKRVFEMNILVQMNTEYYLSIWTRGKAKKLIKTQRVHVFGSDTHNLSDRSQNMRIAIERMKRDGLADWVEDILEMNGEIFQSAT